MSPSFPLQAFSEGTRLEAQPLKPLKVAMGVSQNYESLFGDPYYKDYSIFGSILRETTK